MDYGVTWMSASKEGERLANLCADKAGAIRTTNFSMEAAEQCMLGLLKDRPMAGESLVWGCRDAGIIPHDDRAFGAAVHQLHKKGLIKRIGYCARQRPGTGGPQSVWALA